MSNDDDDDDDEDADDDDDADDDAADGHWVGDREIMREMVTMMLGVAAVLPSEDHCLRSLLRILMTVMVVDGDDDGND
eukprot:1221967-Pyramimonas_sp.AAC.1